MIFKIQRPIISNMLNPEVYAYNEDRDITMLLPMPEEEIEQLFQDDLKQYWEATVDRERYTLKLEHQVEEQDW